MTLIEIQAGLTDMQALALTMYGEARGESVEGRIAVGCVIRNRARMLKTTHCAVCFAPRQFSCWFAGGGAANHGDVLDQAEKLLRGDPVPSGSLLDECLFLADGLIRGSLRDRVVGATHYYSPAGMLPPGRVPKWAHAEVPVAHVGGHLFFRL